MSFLRRALRDEWDGLERISRDVRPADWVTMSNAVVGLVAIVMATRGHTETAALLVLAGILLDGLDGAVARLGGGGGPLGGFLDSLADLVTFAVAPAVLLTTLDAALPLTLAVGGVFLVAVMLRLARFEALREQKDRRYFSGLSSPGGALVVVAAFLVALDPWQVLALSGLAAVLMISRIRYPKLRGWLGVVAVLVILTVLTTSLWAEAYTAQATWGMLAFMLVYVLAGPFYVLARIGPS